MEETMSVFSGGRVDLTKNPTYNSLRFLMSSIIQILSRHHYKKEINEYSYT